MGTLHGGRLLGEDMGTLHGGRLLDRGRHGNITWG